MSRNCDGCNEDLTPELVDDGEDDTTLFEYNGGKALFCIDCWMALGEFIPSQEFKDYAKKYKKNLKKEMKE